MVFIHIFYKFNSWINENNENQVNSVLIKTQFFDLVALDLEIKFTAKLSGFL